jgi:hypothetical protein
MEKEAAGEVEQIAKPNPAASAHDNSRMTVPPVG